MTNPEYTHVTFVVDRSGSMSGVREDAQGGINALMDDQFALPGMLTVTLVEFDTEIGTFCRMADRPVVYSLQPRGMTALLDAVGTEIARTGSDLEALAPEDRPGKVLFVIVTDGLENSSVEFTMQQVRDMVDHQRHVYNWDFQFIGAGESAWQGHDLGMAATSFAPSGAGNRAVYGTVNASLAAYRSGDASASFQMPEHVGESNAPAPDKKAPAKKAPAKKAPAKKAPAKKAPAKKATPGD